MQVTTWIIVWIAAASLLPMARTLAAGAPLPPPPPLAEAPVVLLSRLSTYIS